MEAWIVHKPANYKKRTEMMSAAESQKLLAELGKSQDAVVFSEERGVSKRGQSVGIPIVHVDADHISYQLELCGILEVATVPFAQSDINRLLETIKRSKNRLERCRVTGAHHVSALCFRVG